MNAKLKKQGFVCSSTFYCKDRNITVSILYMYYVSFIYIQ